ncbi:MULTISPECIES: O-antigen ligase family protein [Pseudoalteromonas]|uniref:O-antigen ligase family protein n=1 Tax=Pseudoalteromonas TaxID=53246 RepID=UPI002729941C|nr:O-antigen ligase family protein [Pseudoalteromonas sp.]
MSKLPYTLIFITLYFSLTLLPFIPIFSFDYHNHQRFLQVTLLLLSSILFLVKVGKDKELLLASPIHKFVFLFIVMGFISSAFANEIIFSFFYTIHFLFLFMFFYIVINEESEQTTSYFIASIAIIHSILALVCFLNVIFSIVDQVKLNPFVIYQNFINIRFFNQVQVFIIPLLIFLLKYKDVKRVVCFFLTLNFLLIFIGHARGALLTIATVFLLAQLFDKHQRKEYQTALLCLLIGLLTYYSCNVLFSSGEVSLKTGSSGRLFIWQQTISEFTWKHFFIGNGPGVFQASLEGKAPMSHPHSSVIEVINEWGFLAFIFLSLAIYFTIKNAFAYLVLNNEDSTSKALLYSFVSGLIYSLLSGVHVMPVSQTLLFIVWALLLARTSSKTLTFINFTKWKLIIFVIILTSLWYFYGWVALETYQKMNPDTGYIFGPRFWSIAHRL